jgi:1,4-alpha-glucan branching enzyme
MFARRTLSSEAGAASSAETGGEARAGDARPAEEPGALDALADAIREHLTVPVRFVMPAEGATSVAVAGDFNAWQTDAIYLEDEDGDGVFVGTLRLPPGTYAYAFVLDGERWVADPFASNFRDDGFGTRNAVLRID